MKLLITITLLLHLSISTISATTISPRTSVTSNSPTSISSSLDIPASTPSPNSISSTPTKLTAPTSIKHPLLLPDPANPATTPAPEYIIDSAGRVLTLIHGAGPDRGAGGGIEGGVNGLQEKWHLTTFISCHTFDATFTYCGLHEPVLPGGDEIAAAVRPLNTRKGFLRALMVVLGTLIGVDVFLR